jgi:histidinol-phosphate aminotransferase
MWDPIVPDHIKALTPYPPGKPVSELERELGISHAIKLASNENAIGPSPKAVSAIQDALKDIHRYPDGGAFYLRRRLADHLGVAPDELILGNGSNELIELLVRTFGARGASILTSATTFVVYRLIAQAAGLDLVVAPMDPVALTFDLDAIAERVTKNTRFIFLCNPNNPTGTMFRPEALAAFLERIGDEPIVVLDEAYIEYVEPQWRPDSLGIVKSRPRTVVLRTFSKAYGLAGVRIGYGITSSEMSRYIECVRQPFNTNHLAQVGAMAALDDDDHLAHVLRVTETGKSRIMEGLAEMSLTAVPSHTNFILFDVGRAALPVYQGMLELGVIVRPMHAYGLPNYLRVNTGTHEENERFLSAVRQVLK